MKKALITGITGQDGSYLAELLLSKGYEVHGIIRRSSSFNTGRIDHLYKDPHAGDIKLFLHYGDLSDATNLIRIIQEIKPDEIYNLAAQSHVQVSFETPEYTANSDALGVLRVLEAIRLLGLKDKTKFYQASTSEMFGASLPPQNEQTPFYPRSPYGVAKLYAHWIAINYREAYGIFACSGILFNHECITAQTPIIIKKNDLIDIIAVEEIVPHLENPRHGIKYSTISNGDLEVWDGSGWIKVKTLTATWNKANVSNGKKVKRIICRGGYYEATEDHLSFLKDGKEIKTGNLKNGDHLKLQFFPILNKKTIMSVEEAEFLGMMVADGYVSSDGKGRFINNDQYLRERMRKLWQMIAGGYSREDKHPSGFNKRNNVYSVEFAGNSNYLRLVWSEIYTQKLFKKAPQRILNSKNNIILAFLRGYNSCDGLKGGRQKTEFKSFTTNSSTLALGLWYLIERVLGLRITIHPEFREDYLYFHLNINSNNKTQKGKHLQREISEIKAVKDYNYTGWLFDLETESGTFSAGVGLTWIHNSPRRGETFVTRKITRAATRIHLGIQEELYLGNLDTKRDWGHACDFMESVYLMMQQKSPNDYVIATGEQHSVREFCELAFKEVGIDIAWSGSGINEKGINKKTGKVIIEIDPKYFRPTEVESLLGDYSKAKKELGWNPKISFNELIKEMVSSDLEKAEQEIHLKNNGFTTRI